MGRPAVRTAAPGAHALGPEVRDARRLRRRRPFRWLLRARDAGEPRLARRARASGLRRRSGVMRIAWNAMPVVFLSSACVPPVSSEFPTTPLGPSRALALSHSSTSADVIIEATSADVASWWQLPEGVTWQSFEKLTLVSALDGWKGKPLPDVRDLAVVKRAAAAGANAARLCSSAGTIWIVDMRGAGSVAFGQAMSRASAQPVALV